MVKNIDRMIESVIEREDLMRELAEQESYEDVYDFCTSIEDGYTQEELFGFLDEAYEDYGYAVPEVENNALDYVAGGKGDFRGKIMAGVLSSLALFPASAVGTSALNQNSSKVSYENSASSVENKKGIKAGVRALSAMCNYKYSKSKSDKINLENESKRLDKVFGKLPLTEDTKSQFKNVILSIKGEKLKYANEGKVYNHGDVIYVNAPIFSNEKEYTKTIFADEEPYVYSFSDMDKGSEKSKVEQIFGPTSEDKKSKGNVFYYIKNLFKKSNERKSLYSYIKSHPGRGCVIFNNYKNLHNKDVDEALEKIIDTGKITVSGEEIDCSGMTFILNDNSGYFSNKINRKIVRALSFDCESSFLNKLKIVDFDITPDQKVKNNFNFSNNFSSINYFYPGIKINVTLSDEELNKIIEKEGLKDEDYDELTYQCSLGHNFRRISHELFNYLDSKYGRKTWEQSDAVGSVDVELGCELRDDFKSDLSYPFRPRNQVEVNGKKMYWGIGATMDEKKRFSRLQDNIINSNLHLIKVFNEVKGQTKAKNQLKYAIYQIATEKHYDKYDKPYERADIFYFIGPSDSGKTYMAEKLCEHKVFSDDNEPYFLSAGDIDSTSRASLFEQVFGSENDHGDENNKKTKGNLCSYIKNHPNGVVVFDEYDKLPDNSLDEAFRVIRDTGRITVDGQELDCSGVTFILTSNESRESLNLIGEKNSRKNDSPVTHYKHDASFTRRLHVVEFEKLSESN